MSDLDIIEEVQAQKRQKLTEAGAAATSREGEDDEEDEEEEENINVTTSEAKSALQTLARFATIHGFDERALQSLDNVEYAVKKAIENSMRQTTISSFFKKA